METLPNLICGKFTVGGKDNLPPDTETIVINGKWLGTWNASDEGYL